MAGEARKDLMEKIRTLLIAESTVTGILIEGAAGVVYNFSGQTQDFTVKPKPFITIVGNRKIRGRKETTRQVFSQSITVTLIKDDDPAKDQLTIHDDVKILEAFLTSDDFTDPSFSGHKAWLNDEGYEDDVIFEDGVIKFEFLLDYQYYQNI